MVNFYDPNVQKVLSEPFVFPIPLNEKKNFRKAHENDSVAILFEKEDAQINGVDAKLRQECKNQATASHVTSP